MKKALKVCAALALTAGLVFSAAAFAGCSGDEADLTLIEGNFANQATTEQLADVESRISAVNSANLYGDTSVAGWNYNARMAMLGNIDMRINMSAGGQRLSMNMGMDLDVDHIISFFNEGGGVEVRGSGTVDYSMSLPMVSQTGSVYNIRSGYSGNSYNDTQYFYVDGTVTANNGSQNVTESAKIKTSLGDAFGEGLDIDTDDIAEALIDLDGIRLAMRTNGVTVYVDDSSEDTLKIKVSYSKDSWFNTFYDELSDEMSSAGATGLTYNNLYSGTTFRYMDYYLEFDKESGLLLGFGSKLDATMDMDVVIQGVNTNYVYDLDVDTWVVSTDAVAEDLPSDLSDYVLYN